MSKNGTTKTPAQIRAEAKALAAAAMHKKEAATALAEADAELESAHDHHEEIESLEPIIVPESQPSKLESILSEIGSEGTFQVYYEQPNGSDMKLGQFDIQDYPHKLEALAFRKGGGTFKVVFRNDQGHYKGQTTRTFDPDTYGGGKRMEVTPSVQATDTTAMLTMFQNLQTEMLRQQIAASERTERMMLELVKMNSQGQSPFGGLSLKDMKELFGGDKKSFADEARTMIETLALLRDDANLEPENPWVAALTRGITMLKPFLEAGAARLAAAPVQNAGPGTAPPLPALGNSPPQGSGTALAVPSAPGNPVAQSSAAPAPASTGSPVPPEQQQVVYGQYGAMLYQAAAADSNPEATGNFVLDNLGSILEAENLRAIVADPSVVDRVIHFTPQLREKREWLDAFFGVVREGISEVVAELSGSNEPKPEAESANAEGQS